jgi:hypothetical protein
MQSVLGIRSKASVAASTGNIMSSSATNPVSEVDGALPISSAGASSNVRSTGNINDHNINAQKGEAYLRMEMSSETRSSLRQFYSQCNAMAAHALGDPTRFAHWG